MIKEAIEKILSLAVVEKFNYDGREYASKQLVPVKEPAPPVLTVNTLQGLVDYLSSSFDRKLFSMPAEISGEEGSGSLVCAEDPPMVALHIVSPGKVEAFLPVAGPWKERHSIIQAVWDRQPFPFGKWLSQEEFVIKMQAMFQPSESWQPVMDVAGRIVCEDKAELHDDGVSQAATVSRGIRKESGIILPNPVLLRPVRTFTEVDQPESKFVFRMKPDPICLSLHEADMGAWEVQAKANIQGYLQAALPGVPVFV